MTSDALHASRLYHCAPRLMWGTLPQPATSPAEVDLALTKETAFTPMRRKLRSLQLPQEAN